MGGMLVRTIQNQALRTLSSGSKRRGARTQFDAGCIILQTLQCENRNRKGRLQIGWRPDMKALFEDVERLTMQ